MKYTSTVLFFFGKYRLSILKVYLKYTAFLQGFNQFFWNFHNLKRLLKDLRTEGIKSYPPLISDFINHSCNFWDFLSLQCVLVELISYNNQCPESWNLSYSLVVHPICTWKTKMFVFHFLVLTLLYLLYTC